MAAQLNRGCLALTGAIPKRRATHALPQLLWTSGLACILSAAFAFAWAASFVKLAKRVEPELGIFEIIFIRSLLSIAASVAAARGRPPLGQLRHAHLLALRGLLGTTAMALFYAALVRRARGQAGGGLRACCWHVLSCCCMLPCYLHLAPQPVGARPGLP